MLSKAMEQFFPKIKGEWINVTDQKIKLHRYERYNTNQ